MARILKFLEDDATLPLGALPDEPTADWAAARAKQILDAHEAAGTPAPGLKRFLEHWLRVAPDQLEVPSKWASKLVERDATLTTLLAEPGDEEPRVGILNEREVLATYPDVTGRGNLILGGVLCTPVPAPPPSLAHPTALQPLANATHRERHQLSTSTSAVCAGCHAVASPPGYSFEHFDETGDFRSVDGGKPVDASGTLQSLGLDFRDYADLAPRLATSCEAARCLSELLGRDAFGGELWGGEPNRLSEAEINRIATDLVASGYSIRKLVDAIVRSPSFLR